MISVIVPIFNSESTLKTCINSIVKQSFQDFELILVDDGSNDDSKKICQEFIDNYKNIKYFYKNNSGVSSTRNYGLLQANGKYIVFIDSDDSIEKNYLDIMYKYIVTHHADLVICGYNISYEGMKQEKIYLDEEKILTNTQFYQIFGTLYENNLLNSPWNKIYKKELIKNMFDEKISLGEDLLFNLDYFKNIKKIVIIPDSLYNYRVNNVSNSLSSIYNLNNLYIYYLMYNQIKNTITFDNDKKNNFQKVLNIHFNYLFVSLKLYAISNSYWDFKKFLINEKNNKVYNELLKKSKPTSLRIIFYKIILKKECFHLFYFCMRVEKAIKEMRA
ncbi:hypothetical protein CBF34_02740 [Vagococcus penaei]|uniref:Uncharacterized protein n=1 Tax=Vagococcus penaei TaxID=633807 RepID=A0A1Q2D3Z9_9ENTE|nr:glycosyltransferase family 2 protein [Vagococcus penaei]AQP53092.1 hypothetical protein BW732_01850 [Vagococcus penaei]RSU06046.1 hypothetical protein CBF34_02740 [Vagococcus penaei]